MTAGDGCPPLPAPRSPGDFSIVQTFRLPPPGRAIQNAAMDYDPKPLSVAGVTLSANLLALTERLAENAHDLWAAQRLKDGWTYGPQRDDAKKQHPCLVPYADLPESEKEYDREAALGTLKAILKLGYRIDRPQ